MGKPRSLAMRVGKILLVAVVVISSLASSTEDYAELSDVLGAGELSLKGEKAPETTYSKIPFFALKYKAKKATNAKTVQQCQNLCSGNKVCKSFSFSVRKRDCLLSKTALAFNGHFTFYSKRANPKKPDSDGGINPMSPYRDFVGLMYQGKDWTRYKGHSKESCEDLCNRAKDSWGRTCHGFSYRLKDQTCLLSPFGVRYDTDYDYYERNPQAKALQKKLKPKKKKGPGPKMSSEYKTNLKVQEGKAKWGKKELAHKQTLVKKVKRGKKKLKLQFKILKKKEKHEMTLAEERKHKRAVAEKTQKKFILVRKKQQERKRKKDRESQTKLNKQKAKLREKLSKELKYKTRKKKIEKAKKEKKSKLKGKIDSLIKMSIRLTAS